MDRGGVRLLYDHNLPPRLVQRLEDVFPGAAHLLDLGMERAGDGDVWEYAAVNGLTIVTKDSDFSDLSLARGAPPKVVWLRIGNSTLGQVELVLRAHHGDLAAFDAAPEASLLVIR